VAVYRSANKDIIGKASYSLLTPVSEFYADLFEGDFFAESSPDTNYLEFNATEIDDIDRELRELL